MRVHDVDADDDDDGRGSFNLNTCGFFSSSLYLFVCLSILTRRFSLRFQTIFFCVVVFISMHTSDRDGLVAILVCVIQHTVFYNFRNIYFIYLYLCITINLILVGRALNSYGSCYFEKYTINRDREGWRRIKKSDR